MIFGLLGPSGAGKTTLIKIITGQLGFDSGDVSVFGKNVSDLTGTDKKQIGIMMDDHGVYDRLSCTDNLKIFADIYGIPHSKIISALEEVGLKDAAKKPAMKLSKGMRARLQLARVFMVSPKILFLDEPTSGLDPVSRAELLGCVLNNYYTTEFADHVGYGIGGRYGYGTKYGYGRYGSKVMAAKDDFHWEVPVKLEYWF